MIAILKENKEVCKRLIELGAKTEIEQRDGETAIFIASYKGDIEICKILIKSGVDVNSGKRDG